MRRPNSIREEMKFQKISKKDKWDREVRDRNKRDKRIKNKDDRCRSSKLLGDLSNKKGTERDEIKEIEIKLEKITMLQKIVNTIKRLVIPEKCGFYR